MGIVPLPDPDPDQENVEILVRFDSRDLAWQGPLAYVGWTPDAATASVPPRHPAGDKRSPQDEEYQPGLSCVANGSYSGRFCRRQSGRQSLLALG